MSEAATDLETVEQVIDALGGLTATGRLVSSKTQTVYQWRETKRFPAKTYLALQAALKERGLSAPADLWRMVE